MFLTHTDSAYAFNLGCDCRLNGVSYIKNPYDLNLDPLNYRAWQNGWKDVDNNWGRDVNNRWFFKRLKPICIY